MPAATEMRLASFTPPLSWLHALCPTNAPWNQPHTSLMLSKPVLSACPAKTCATHASTSPASYTAQYAALEAFVACSRRAVAKARPASVCIDSHKRSRATYCARVLFWQCAVTFGASQP